MSKIVSEINGLSTETKIVLGLSMGVLAWFGFGKKSGRSASSSGSSDANVACSDITINFKPEENMPEKDMDFFMHMFNRLKKEIVADLQSTYELPGDTARYVERMIDYTCINGKMTRGLSVVQVQAKLAADAGRKLTNKDRMQSAALGWCIEFLQAFFLVADDIMDDSKTRRGQPCWYLLPDVQKVAINDSFILESCVYKILKRYFGAETYYLNLVELFVEVTRQTEMGQLLDLTAVNQMQVK